jgi:hypothetical protein
MRDVLYEEDLPCVADSDEMDEFAVGHTFNEEDENQLIEEGMTIECKLGPKQIIGTFCSGGNNTDRSNISIKNRTF